MLDQGNAVAAKTAFGTDISSDHRLEHIKSLLQKEFGETVFRSWISPLTLQSAAGGVLELVAPTRFMRDWVKAHYADRIRVLWTHSFGGISRVDIVAAAKSAARRPEEAPAAGSAPATTVFERTQIANDAGAIAGEAPGADTLSSPLDPRFTFENFVVGKSNELAYAAAHRVADSDTAPFNPLFLHGGVGLGKTHLMHAIAHAVRARNPERKVVYMSAEKFMYQFVSALRLKNTMSFKQQCRSIDILMIDDIQFICGKDATQEEFFHTFNALIDQGKQVIVTSDRSPSDLDGIEERLRSRLGWGLVADIHPTTYELRLGILQSKCALLKRAIPLDVFEFLAQKIVSNVRELEGALNRLIAHAELVGKPVVVETAQELLQDLLRSNDRRVSIEDIQKKVAEHFNIRLSDMHSPRRARPVARPRQIAMYLAESLTEHSLPEIGRKFGGRDHTTILHGVRKIKELLVADNRLKEDIDILKKQISG